MKDDDDTPLKRVVRAAMEDGGFNPTTFTRELGLKADAIRDIFRNKAGTRGETVQVLADYLGWSVIDLLTAKDVPRPLLRRGAETAVFEHDAPPLRRSRPTPGARMRVTIELLGRTVDDVAAEMHIPVDELRAALDAPGPPEPALLALFCEITQVGRAWVTRGDVEAVSRYMAASLGFLHPEMVSGLIDQKERRRGKASEAGET